MTRLLRAAALAASVSLALATQSNAAHAEQASGPPPAWAAVASAEKVATLGTGTAAMGSLMIVLDVLGIVEKDAPKESSLARVPVRKPTWLSPEPPKTPLLYSSVVVAKF
jgi:hypothetical protein